MVRLEPVEDEVRFVDRNTSRGVDEDGQFLERVVQFGRGGGVPGHFGGEGEGDGFSKFGWRCLGLGRDVRAGREGEGLESALVEDNADFARVGRESCCDDRSARDS